MYPMTIIVSYPLNFRLPRYFDQALSTLASFPVGRLEAGQDQQFRVNQMATWTSRMNHHGEMLLRNGGFQMPKKHEKWIEMMVLPWVSWESFYGIQAYTCGWW